MAIDIIDEKLLEVLQDNARISISELSKKINLSLSAVSERLKKLEQTGVICKYTAIFDPQVMDKNLQSIISVSVENPGSCKDFLKVVDKNKDIVSCRRVTGDCDFILTAYSKDAASLEELLNKISSVSGVVGVNSQLILSTYKDKFGVAPVAGK